MAAAVVRMEHGALPVEYNPIYVDFFLVLSEEHVYGGEEFRDRNGAAPGCNVTQHAVDLTVACCI